MNVAAPAAAAGRALWGACGLLALALVVTFARTSTAAFSLELGVILLALLASASPAAALLALAALLPFTTSLAHVAGGVSGTVLAEALVLAVVGPWLARQAVQRRVVAPAERRGLLPAALFAAVVVASAAVQVTALGPQLGGAGLASELWLFLTRDYFERSNLLGVVVVAAATLEGLALLLMTVSVTTRAPATLKRLVLLLVAASAGAAAINLGTLLGLAIGSDAPVDTLRELWLLARISVHYDRNAAGSVFAMLAVIAAAQVPGAAGRGRVLLAAALGLLLAGLWITGSRAAMAAFVLGLTAVVGIAAWRSARAPAARRLWLAAAALLVAAAVVAAAYPAARNPTVSGSVTGRQELAIAAMEMWRTHPVYGAGLGRFYELSDEYGHPQMAQVLPPGSTGENAHNNFLQILAELGLLGLGLFLWLLAAAAAPALYQLRSRSLALAGAGILAGVATFVLTWLTGHPLLVPEAQYVFFIVLGVLGGAAAVPPGARPRVRIAVAVVVVCLLGALLPMRIERAVAAVDLEHIGQGLSAWQRDPDVERYRWAGPWSLVFVPTGPGAVDLPVRAGEGTVSLDVLLDGRLANRLEVSSDEWTHLRIIVGPSKARFRRVELRGSRDDGAVSLKIGKVRGVLGEMRDEAARPAPANGERARGDVDGDGRTDVLIFRPVQGDWLVNGRQAASLGAPGDVPVPADYDGDGRVELATFRASDGSWHIEDTATIRFGAPGDRPVPADYDGDGRADLALFTAATGTWTVRGRAPVQFGDPGDLPIPADYDGNGTTDIAVFRPSTRTWYVRDLSATPFGDTDDIPVPGDYDGDGMLDLAVYRPSSRTWYVRDRSAVQYGGREDEPLPGDYDGDGRTDIAVYRPATGRWFVLQETSAGFFERLWSVVARR